MNKTERVIIKEFKRAKRKGRDLLSISHLVESCIVDKNHLLECLKPGGYFYKHKGTHIKLNRTGITEMEKGPLIFNADYFFNKYSLSLGPAITLITAWIKYPGFFSISGINSAIDHLTLLLSKSN